MTQVPTPGAVRAIQPNRTDQAIRAGLSAIHAGTLQALRINRAPLLLAAAYVLSVNIASSVYGFKHDWTIYIWPWAWATLQIYGWVMVVAVVVAIVADRPKSPIDYLKSRWAAWRMGDRMLAALPWFLITPLVLASYTSLKTAFGTITGYRLDPYLARIDELLHGGPAWTLIQPLLGSARATKFIDNSYQLWFVLMYAVLLFNLVMVERPQLRRQFLTGFILCWSLVGSLGGALLSSVGPGYYADFFPDARFADQLQFLKTVSEQATLRALTLQSELLQGISAGSPVAGGGISAMPSMHVALSSLFALWAWRISRTAGVMATAFLVIIQLGSVHLAWHYAIDGYVSMIAMAVIWRVSGFTLSPKASH